MMASRASGGFPARLAGLLRPAAYPHPVARVKRVTTHLSWVLVAGERAYKIKRPVQFSFVDFSSVDQRRHYCEEELRLNRRFAPALYERVARITSGPDGARVDGEGALVDYAVVMCSFEQREVLAERVHAGEATAAELATFGASLARLHAAAPRPEPDSPAGTSTAVAVAMARNASECLVATRVFGNQAEVALLAGEQRKLLGRMVGRLDERRLAGRVREGHGDLHMGNIVRQQGTLLAFDALEFDADFRWGDVAQDVAFLCADLRAAGHPELAQAFLNGYLQVSGDYGLLQVLELYVADRALVRAKVMALLAAGATTALALHELQQQKHLQVAREAMAARQPACVLMHGPSGSGKSWLASQLAGPCQSVVVRSDVERQRMAAMAARRNQAAGQAPAQYGPDPARAVYARLRDCALQALQGGQCVILDATYSLRAERARVAELCRAQGVPLVVIDCQAPTVLLAQRVAARLGRHDDASEATLEVLQRQLAASEPLAEEEGLQVVVALTEPADAWRRVLSRLRVLLPGLHPPGGQRPGGQEPPGAARDCA
jgi:aminoglycoside phosphotransferase family enzyme/predicted kinase